MISQERKDQLIATGYEVEDMQKVWGDGWWNGQFRWLNGDDYGNPQDSVEASWADASQYQDQLDAIEAREAARLAQAPTLGALFCLLTGK